MEDCMYCGVDRNPCHTAAQMAAGDPECRAALAKHQRRQKIDEAVAAYREKLEAAGENPCVEVDLPHTVHLGTGAFIIGSGFYRGLPAVFIEPAPTPREPGTRVAERTFPADELAPGSTVISATDLRSLEVLREHVDKAAAKLMRGVAPLTEDECFMVEAAMYYGFRHVDDDATVFQATESQIVALVKAAREQGRQDVAKGGLDLAVLRAANLARQAVWCPDQVPDLSFRGNELAGEAGEAMEAAFNTIAAMGALMVAIGRASNTIKKLERERQGWAGSRATEEQLAEELADVVICADLCGITANIDLSPAVVAKFNATSEKVGLPTRLSLEQGVTEVAPAPNHVTAMARTDKSPGHTLPEGWEFGASAASHNYWSVTLVRLGDGHQVKGLSNNSMLEAQRRAQDLAWRAPALRLAEGCRSASSPCGHQKRDPFTLCDICSGKTEAPRPEHEQRGWQPK